AAFPGIGLKTSSWVVRNHRASDAIAVIDVHILRAGRHIGLFPQNLNAQRHYRELEGLFLKFAVAIDVPAGQLDALMWDYMRRLSGAIADPRARQLRLFDRDWMTDEATGQLSSMAFASS
ncbi:MAG: Integrase, partial [Bryobacterales bacterium]|nr:Integrase [Bryobacterales bacterium]